MVSGAMSGILSSSMLYARDAVRHEAECSYLYISAPGYIFTQHEPSTEYINMRSNGLRLMSTKWTFENRHMSLQRQHMD